MSGIDILVSAGAVAVKKIIEKISDEKEKKELIDYISELEKALKQSDEINKDLITQIKKGGAE